MSYEYNFITPSGYTGGYSFIGGGRSCTISTTSYTSIGGTDNYANNYTTKPIIGSGTNNTITTQGSILKKDPHGEPVDNHFIEMSKELDGQAIMKYSPMDNKWKVYINGVHTKISKISMDGCDTWTAEFPVGLKTIGVLLVRYDEVEFIDDICKFTKSPKKFWDVITDLFSKSKFESVEFPKVNRKFS